MVGVLPQLKVKKKKKRLLKSEIIMIQTLPLPLAKNSGVISHSQYKSCVAGLGMVA